MCVLILLRNPLPDWPVVVAADRDELRARPAAGPQILEGCAVAGRDLAAGGTWLGVNREGTIVALTNRREPPRSEHHSRGRLVLDALQGRDWNGRPTGGYNLLVAGPREQIAWEYDGTARRRDLRSALHVISSNRDVDDPAAPEATAVRRMFRPCPTIDALRDHLRGIQSSHDGGICKHGEMYGTVSACFLALHRSGPAASQFWCADGPPCAGRWSDRSDLLRQLR